MSRFLQTNAMLVGVVCLASAPWAMARPASPAAQTPATKQAAAVEARIRDRVTAYWKARMTTNLAACFPYYEASFRAQHTPESFARDFRRLNRFAPEFLGIRSVTLDPAGTRATVKVKLRTRPAILDGRVLDSDVDEIWLLESGEWSRAAEPLMPQI